MKTSRGPLLVLVMLVILAAAAARAGEPRDRVVVGLAGSAHFRIERANRELDQAIADAGGRIDLAAIRGAYDQALATGQEVARGLRTAFALAVTSAGVDSTTAGLFNTAVDATVALTARLEELLATSESPLDAREQERYQRALAGVRAVLADRKGGIKKLDPGPATR